MQCRPSITGTEHWTCPDGFARNRPGRNNSGKIKRRPLPAPGNAARWRWNNLQGIPEKPKTTVLAHNSLSWEHASFHFKTKSQALQSKIGVYRLFASGVFEIKIRLYSISIKIGFPFWGIPRFWTESRKPVVFWAETGIHYVSSFLTTEIYVKLSYTAVRTRSYKKIYELHSHAEGCFEQN